MPVYRFRPTTFAVNPTADSGSDANMTGTGAVFSDATKLAAFAGLSDGIPGSYPGGFPPQSDAVPYQNAIAYYDASSIASGRSDRIRATNMLEVGTNIAIATKLTGHTINSAWMRIGLMDGDLYAGFPSGGGGLLHLHGVRVELRNASGALASSYRQFASIFSDGGNPAMLNLNSSPWTPALAAITSAFGFNFYVYNSDNADSFELTPNLGVFALELSVDATAPGGSAPPSTTHLRHHRRSVAGSFLGGLE